MDLENSGVIDAVEEVSQSVIDTTQKEEGVQNAESLSDDVVENAEEQAANEGSETAKRQRRGGFQKKIERLAAEKAQLQAELASLRAGIPPEHRTQSVRAPSAAKPIPESFDSYDDYVDALTDWKVENRLTKEKEQTRQQTTQESFARQVQEARKAYGDFDEALAEYDFETLPKHSAEAILESPMGAEIAYYIANNPEVGDRLRGMTALQAGREIGRLEYKLELEKKQVKAAPKVTKAPAPIVPLKAKAVANRTIYDDDLSYEEFRSAVSRS